MNKILYFLASVDQELKRRRPDGTPYFNLRVYLIFIMFLHYFQLAMIEKARGVETFPHSKNLFVIGLLVVSTFIYFYIGILFPLDQIQEIEVDKKDVKRNYYILLIYMFVNIGILMYLGFLLIPKHS